MRNNRVLHVTCRDCNKPTNQRVLFSVFKKLFLYEIEDDLPPPYDVIHYITIQCAGCGQISFLQRTMSEQMEDEEGNPLIFDNIYPSTDGEELFNFLRPDEESELPSMLQDLYDEVRTAFINNSSILAGIGLRSLVEGLCLQQKITGDTLQKKIKNLQSVGVISLSEVPILDKLRLIGNFSAHQIKAFPIDKLEYALDIVNHVLRSVYVLPKINKKLKF
jgi:hypothetical protein